VTLIRTHVKNILDVVGFSGHKVLDYSVKNKPLCVGFQFSDEFPTEKALAEVENQLFCIANGKTSVAEYKDGCKAPEFTINLPRYQPKPLMISVLLDIERLESPETVGYYELRCVFLV
jgi:hypothetical protein